MGKIPDKHAPVALVTGSGKRLGRQIAYALAESGFNLVIHFNSSKSGAQEAVKHIQSLGRQAIALRADISKERQVKSLVERSIKYFKRIDVLINNSGVFIESPLLKTTELIWDRTIDINLKGVFLCSQAISRIMLRQREGRIINIASLGGLQAWKEHLPYSVSKAAVIMLTRCLAKALAPDIMVNAIAPGVIILPNEEDAHVGHIDRKRIPLQRYGQASDVTSLVLYLAKTSSYITGQTIVVDGGRYT